MKLIKNTLTIFLTVLTITSHFAHADEAADKLYQEAEFEHASGLDNSAFKKYQILAGQGNANAQYRIGYMYYKGESRYGQGPGKNAKLAIDWFQKAANQGHQQAQTYLSQIYYYGKGVPEDRKLAKFWYKKSAAQDNNLANSELYPADIIKQIDEEIQLTDASELNEAKSKGFDSYADLTFATKISATPAELATLKSLGVKTENDYSNVIARKEKLAYGGENTIVMAIQFLTDEQDGKKIKLGPIAYRAKLNKQATEAQAKAAADKAREKADAEKARVKAEAEAAATAVAEARAKANAEAKASASKTDNKTKPIHTNANPEIGFAANMLAFATIQNSTAIDKNVGDDNRWYQLIISPQLIVCSQLTETPSETLETLNKILGITKTEDIKIDGTTVETLITQSDGRLSSLYLGRARCKAMQKFTEEQREAKKIKSAI